jgi:hypothetical protein
VYPPKNHPSAARFQKAAPRETPCFFGGNSNAFDFAAAMAITAAVSLFKDAIEEGTPRRRSECGARGRKDTVRTRAARASCLPALRLAREVHRCDRTGGACGHVRSSMPPFGKPGPKLSPRDESPLGENRKWNAGRRARPQAEGGASRLSVARPARRLRAGINTMRLPAFRFLLFCA